MKERLTGNEYCELESDTAKRERSSDYQRQVLLELHEACQIMARHNGRALHFDHIHARHGQFTQTA